MSAFDGSPWVRRLARRKSLAAPGLSGIFTLAGINTNDLPDGTVVWVSDVVSDYRFLRESTAAPDGFNRIKPAAGPGIWFREGSPNGGCCAPLSEVLVVDGGTKLLEAEQNGSECCPFATPQQAFAALAGIDPDKPVTIEIRAGKYIGPFKIPARDALALVGDGPIETILTADFGEPAVVAFQPGVDGANVHSLAIRNLSILSSIEGQVPLDLLGPASPTPTTLTGGCFLDNVQLTSDSSTPPIRARIIGRLHVRDCVATTGPLFVHNVTDLVVQRTALSSDDLSFDFTAPFPTSGRGLYLIDDSTEVAGDTALSGQVAYEDRQTTRLQTVTGTALSAAGINGPRIVLRGRHESSTNLVYPDISNAVASLNLTNGTFVGPVSVSVDPLSALVLAAQARGAVFQSNVLAGSNTSLDIRGSFYEEGLLSAAPTGFIDRDHTTLGPLLADQPANGYTFAALGVPNYPPGVGGAYVLVVNQLAGAFTSPPKVTGQSSTGFTLEFPAPDGNRTVNVQVLRA